MLDEDYYIRLKKAMDRNSIIIHKWGRENDPKYYKAMKYIQKQKEKKEIERYFVEQEKIRIEKINNDFYNELIRVRDDNVTKKTYIIGDIDKDCVKIGTAKNVSRRLSQLNTSTPDKLKIIYWVCTDKNIWFSRPEFEEKKLHNICKEYHINKEWYKKEVIDFINKLYEL